MPYPYVPLSFRVESPGSPGLLMVVSHACFDPRPCAGDSHNSTAAELVHLHPALFFVDQELPGVVVTGLAVSRLTSEPSFKPRNVLYGPVTTSVPSLRPE